MEPDLADRRDARVVAVRTQCVSQALDLGVRRAAGLKRVDAQRVGQAVPMREGAYGVELAVSTECKTSMGTPAAAVL